MRLCILKMGRMLKKQFEINKYKKRSRKREKCIIGPHTSVHFENGPNAKNSLKSTEVNEKCHNRSTFEEKLKDAVIRQPTLSTYCKLSKLAWRMH